MPIQGRSKYKENVYNTKGLDYFYTLYLKSKIKHYVKSLRGLMTLKTKRKVPLKQSVHSKILKTYLNVYLNKIYFNKEPRYFFLSGLIEKSVGTKLFIDTQKVNTYIVLHWFQRPSSSYNFGVGIYKVHGIDKRTIINTLSTTRIERMFKKIGNFDELKTHKEINAKFKSDDAFYKRYIKW